MFSKNEQSRWVTVACALLFYCVLMFGFVPCVSAQTSDPTVSVQKAMFGVGPGTQNITKRIVQIIKDKKVKTRITTPGMKIRNPSGKYRSQLKIWYTVDGRQGIVVLKNNQVVNIYQAIIDNHKKEVAAGVAADTKKSDPKQTSPPPKAKVSQPPKEKPKPTEGVDYVEKFESGFSSFVVGGSGKFLFLHFKEKRILAIYDLDQKKTVKEISLAGDIRFAASQNKLLIANLRIHRLERWDLKTLTQDATGDLDRENPPSILAMGSHGNGPLGMIAGGKFELWDVEQMEKMAINGPSLPDGGTEYRLCVSSDGKTFCGYGAENSYFKVLRVNGNTTSVKGYGDMNRHNQYWAMPSFYGERLLRYGGTAYGFDGKLLATPQFKGMALFPCGDPRYVIAVSQNDKNYSKAIIATAADFKPVHTETKLETITNQAIGTLWGRLQLQPLVLFRPEKNELVYLPTPHNRVVFRSLDLKAKLEATKKPYLIVNSKPDINVQLDQTFDYQITALSSENVIFKLDQGPQGMTCTPNGKVTWKIGREHRGEIASVQITAKSNQGNEFIHSFEIPVPGASTMVVVGAEKTGSTGTEINPIVTKSKEVIFQLPEPYNFVRTGGGGRYMIFHFKNAGVLSILDLVKRQFIYELKVPENVACAAGKSKFFVALPESMVLQRWDFETLKLEKSVRMDGSNVPIAGVMGSNCDGPVVMWGKGGAQFFDPESLEPISSQYDGKMILSGIGDWGFKFAASPNGKTYTAWDKIIEYDHGIQNVRHIGNFTQRGGYLLPTNDGSIFPGYGKTISHELKPIQPDYFKNRAVLPCVDQRYLVVVEKMGERYNPSIYTSSDFRLVHNLQPVQSKNNGPHARNWETSPGGEHCARYLSDENLFVFLTDGKRELHLRELDIEAELKQTGASYLVVNSKPDISVNIGETFTYQVDALSSSPVTYKLDKGPEGMTLTPSGQLTWTLTTKYQDQVVDVLINATNEEGKNTQHAFSIPVKLKRVIIAADAGRNGRGTSGDIASNNNPKQPGGVNNKNPDSTGPLPGEFIAMLDDKFNNMTTGGNGRYLIFQFAEKENLAIFDITKRAVVKEISAPKDALIAASKEKLVIVFPKENKIERWDLDSLRRDKARDLDPKEVPEAVAMGENSDGPLGIWANGTFQLLELDTLKQIDFVGEPITDGPNQHRYNLGASANGKAFVAFIGHNGKFRMIHVDGNNVTSQLTDETHTHPWFWALPSDDGSRLMRYGGKAYTFDMKLLQPEQWKGWQVYPSGDPRFLIGIKSDGKNKSKATIFTAADFQAVHTFDDMPDMSPGHLPNIHGRIGLEPRCRYLTESKQFISLPASNDRVCIQSFDLPSKLSVNEAKFLFVTSIPPASVNVDETLEYQMSAFSNSENVTYKLNSGPDGLKVSTDGKIEWNVKNRPLGGLVHVSVLAQSPGNADFEHGFDVVVKRKLDEVVSEPVDPGKGRWYREGTNAGYVAIDELRLELPRKPTAITQGLDGKMLLLSGDELSILSKDGWTVEKTARLDKEYLKICERENYYVAITKRPSEICLIDKTSLKVTKSLKLPFRHAIDLVLHPKEQLSYVSGDRSGDVPQFKFLIFDERSGEGYEDESWIGNYLAIDRSGQHLFTALYDIYEKGSRLLVNPNRIDVVPDYGSINWLVKFRVDRKGHPELVQVLDKAGGNCTGIRLSPDGKRVTYLSHVGFPMGSRNTPAWNTDNIKTVPMMYETKGIATPKLIEYHPTLPLVVSPGKGSLTFYESESASIEKDRLTVAASEFQDLEFSQMHFSPDGESLVVVTAINGISYIYKLGLKLSAPEKQRNELGLKSIAELADADPPAAATVALAEFDSFKGGADKKISTADIADMYTESVPIVSSGDSAGTGFVLSSSGYVFTCAHCIQDANSIELIFKKGKDDSFKTKAKLIAINDSMDVALLKAEWKRSYKPVRLSIGRRIRMGGEVSILGHPGNELESYNFTMTKGIVSNPDREIEGVSMIQTSAEINTGNSGGPMFDEFGFVIGMVALKSRRVEGAGFAISADEIAKFIIERIDRDPESLKLERDWYDKDGRGPLSATLISYSRGEIKINRTSDNREFTLKVEDLSDADQAFIKMFRDHKHKQLN